MCVSLSLSLYLILLLSLCGQLSSACLFICGCKAQQAAAVEVAFAVGNFFYSILIFSLKRNCTLHVKRLRHHLISCMPHT